MSGSRPDVVLINPRSRTEVYQGLGKELAAIENPVWAGLMATYVRRQGLSAEIIDAEADELAPAEVAQRVLDLDPVLSVVVVYGHQPSASTQIMPASGAAARAIKDAAPDQKVLMVGGHVAALPSRTLEEEACDFVAGGEGLFTIVELTKSAQSVAVASAAEQSPRPLVLRKWPHERRPERSLGAKPRRGNAGSRLGPASYAQVPRPQLALFRPPGAEALRGHLHDAGLPLPLHVLLHPGPLQER